ncbi:MAG: SgcJ/EcaC family oxidoreductase [Leptolyngbya sp. SIO1D8]|nr:SgcJ/EcaC family oxidoreductase [Leptolyngbya sp. SIO1D8]
MPLLSRRGLTDSLVAVILLFKPEVNQIVGTSHQIDVMIQQARQAWLEGNGSAFAALFSTAGEFIVPGQKWQGRAAILEAFRTFSAAHSVNVIEIRNCVVRDNRVMLEWYWEDREHLTGKVSQAEDEIAIDFHGDLIQRWREYIDTASCQQPRV